MVSPENVTRRFIARLLGVEVAKDGQVPGYAAWTREVSPFAVSESLRIAHWCWVKIERDGRDMEECIGAGVRYFEAQLQHYRPAELTVTRAEYVRFRSLLTQRITDESLTPLEVARILESAADEYQEIGHDECMRLREMGFVWQPVAGPPLSDARTDEIRAAREAGQRGAVAARPREDAKPKRVEAPNDSTHPRPTDEHWPGWGKAGYTPDGGKA